MNNTLSLTPAASAAASTTQPAPTALPTDAGANASLWSSLAVTALALVFVLGLAWLFLHLLKRMGTLRGVGASAPPQVVQAIALGGRERLVVVRDGPLEYVLGVTANQVNLIDKRPATDPQTRET